VGPVHGITVYGCQPDEAALFRMLAPRFGIVPALTSSPVLLVGDGVLPVPGNRCISVGHTTEVPEAALRALKRAGVDYLSTRSVGVDHIDLAAAERLGVTVENAAYAPDGVADYTLMLILMAVRHARRLLDADVPLDSPRDRELRDLTVGVVGVGRIGSAVVERLRGFGCRVLAHDTGRGAPSAAERVPLDRLLRESDVITLHVPLAARTRGLLGRAELAAMRPGAFLINTARGALLDTAALLDALESGRLGGAALDVVDADDAQLRRLRARPDVIVTPHTAYYTERALHDTVEQTLVKCLAFERGRVDA
jgi:D-specific alpha-keto acid dehydrogenase